MGDVWWNDDPLPGPYEMFFSIYFPFKAAFDNVGNLFAFMVVIEDNAPLFKVAIQEGHMSPSNFSERNLVPHFFKGHCFEPECLSVFFPHICTLKNQSK